MPNQIVTLDASKSPALTSQVGLIGLTRQNFRFAALDPSGRDFKLLDSDQATQLTATLRTYDSAAGIGMRLIEKRFRPTGTDAKPYIFCTAQATGDLGLPNPPHQAIGWGSTIGDATPALANGRVDIFDRLGTLLFSIQSPNHDYPMSCRFADVQGDGTRRILIGWRIQEGHGYVYSYNGSGVTSFWSYDIGLNPQGAHSYVRVNDVGKASNSYPGNQVLFGGSDGHLALLDKDGNLLPNWPVTPVLDQAPYGNSSVQRGKLFDLSGSGLCSVYCVQASRFRKLDASANIVWAWDHGSETNNSENNFYDLDAGYITGTTVKQLVAASATYNSSNNLGNVSVLNDLGSSASVAWQRYLPWPLYSVCCGDVNGDGYDEIIVAGGTNTTYLTGNGWGVVTILDRHGDELASVSVGSSCKFVYCADYDGDGQKEVLVSCDDGYWYAFKVESPGVTVKATIPSISAASTRNLYVASSGSLALPPQGDLLFNLSGADGSSPTGWTQRLGVWTIQGGRLQSPSDLNVATAACCELTGSSIEAGELRFKVVKSDQADGSSEYYSGVRYRCTNWASGLPTGYLAQFGSRGTVAVLRTASGVGGGTPLVGGGSGVATGVTLSTTDVLEWMLVWSGADHSLCYRINTGEWVFAFHVQDASGPTAPGSVAFYSGRGQSQFFGATLKAVPNSYGSQGTGPAPFYLASTANNSGSLLPFLADQLAGGFSQLGGGL